MASSPTQPIPPLQSDLPPQTGGPWTPPPRTGMGCGARLLIGLGIVLLLLILFCCGGGLGIGFWVQRGRIDDPVDIAATAKEITDIDVPAPLEPVRGLQRRIPFLRLVVMMAAYADKQRDSTLVLMTLGGIANQAVRDQLREQIEEGLQQQGLGTQNQAELQNSKRSEKEVKIRGQDATFTIISGTSAKSQKQRIQVQGTFKGKDGPVILILDVDAEKLPREKVEKMLDSIR